MSRTVPYVICVVLCFALGLRAQDGNGNGHDKQPPTQQQIDTWITALRGEENENAIHNRVSELGATHATVRAALYGLLADADIRPGLFKALLSWIVNENDRSPPALLAVMGVIASPAAQRAAIALRQLEALDRRQPSLLSDLLARVRDPKNGDRKTWVEAAWLLARDRADERAYLADALIAALEAGSDNGLDEAIKKTLHRVTLQKFNGAAAWRSWYGAYVATHGKAGFAYEGLFAEAMRGVEDSSTRAHLNAIKLFIAAGALPSAYVDAAKYPEPRVRRAAVGGLLKAAGQATALRIDAAKILLSIVGSDPDSEVRQLAVRDLVAVVEKLAPDATALRDQIATAMAARLEEPDRTTLRLAVRGIGKAGTKGKGFGAKLSAVYVRMGIGGSDDAAAVAVRTDVIEALSALQEGTPTVLAALADDDLNVRRRAAGAVRALGDPQHAVKLAAAWAETDDPNYRRDFILAIESLQNYNPEVVTSCLIQAIAKGEPETTPALRTLVKALRSKGDRGPGAEQVVKIRGFLVSWIPTKLDVVKRGALIKDEMVDLSGAIGEVALAWALAEADGKVRTQLVTVIAGAAPTLPFARLELLAKHLEDKKAWPDAEVLLAGLVTRTGHDQAPEGESRKNAGFKLRHANALSQQGKHVDAENLLTLAIEGQGAGASYTLFRARADYLLAQGTVEKKKAALKDLAEALKRAGETIAPSIRKGLLIEAARLERDLGNNRAAYDHATLAEGLEGPGDTTRVRIETGLRLIDPEVLGGAVDAYAKLVKAGGVDLTATLKKVADAHVTVRGLVAKLDAGGPEAEASAKVLTATDAKVVCPWLVRGLVALASNEATHPALRARLALLKKLDERAPAPPPDTADAAALGAA
ncbi:MAG: hypothetical protein HRU14_01320, partial [Planctomycetes bacterium]|nr:hypothetical protein [Planctomycetota bacterium]